MIHRMSRNARLGRKLLLASATLALLTAAAVIMLAVAILTLFRAGRLYSEVMAKWLSRAILTMWGVRLEAHRTEPFPKTQTVYVSNHSSTLDMFALVALGLPRTRFVGAEDLDGFLRWMAPLGIMSWLTGTLWAPPPSKPAERARWFQRTERLLRQTGGSIYLSPEGERVTTGRLGPFNSDNFQLAANLGAPIVPLYIEIPRDIDPGRGFDALPGTIHVHVKPTIPTRGWTPDSVRRHSETLRDRFVGIQEQLSSGRPAVASSSSAVPGMSDETSRERAIVAAFLSSSWYAEEEASSVVARLLRHPCSAEERDLLVAYAQEEDLHADLIEAHFRERGLTKGPPFWMHPLLRLARSRAALLLQFYSLELTAGVFYGAMASKTRDPGAKALIRRLLLDEAWHIRLHRGLLARELSRLSPRERLRMRALAWLYRRGMDAGARFQARQLAPVLGSDGRALPRKIAAHLRADLPGLFGRTNSRGFLDKTRTLQRRSSAAGPPSLDR